MTGTLFPIVLIVSANCVRSFVASFIATMFSALSSILLRSAPVRFTFESPGTLYNTISMSTLFEMSSKNDTSPSSLSVIVWRHDEHRIRAAVLRVLCELHHLCETGVRNTHDCRLLSVHRINDELRYPLPLLLREGSELSDGTERNHRRYLGFEKERNVLLDTLHVERE